MNLNKKNLWKPAEPNKAKRLYWTAAGAAVLCLCCATPAMAAGSDPLDIVNNLSDFIFSIIKALGVIILGCASCRWVCRSSPTTPAKGRRDSSACLAA